MTFQRLTLCDMTDRAAKDGSSTAARHVVEWAMANDVAWLAERWYHRYIERLAHERSDAPTRDAIDAPAVFASRSCRAAGVR